MGGTLLVLCTVLLAGPEKSQLVQLTGNEVVYKQTQGTKWVYFESLGESTRVKDSDCTYLENPERVSQQPDMFFASEQPKLTAEEERLWTTQPELTVKQILGKRKNKQVLE